MDVDDCLSKVVGEFGKYHIFVYCFMFIYGICTPGLILFTVFAGEDPSKLKLDNDRVNNESSILTEWDLLDEQWVGDLVQAMFFAGFLVGVVAFGQLSDRLGRRLAVILGYSLLLPVCILTSYSTSLQMFTVMRCLTGLICGGVTLVQYVYLQEIVGRSWWTITGTLQGLMFPLGVLLFVFGAYFIPAWRSLLRFLTIFQIPPLIFIMFIPESPRWLYSKGQLSKAERVLELVAKRNGVKNPVCILKPLELDASKHTYTLLDLFRHPVTAKRVLVMAFLWFVNTLVYYALTLAAGEIGSNTYASEALSGVIEVPSYILTPLLLSRLWCGRKRGVAFALLVTGFSCLLMMAFDASQKSDGKMAVGLLGKMAVTFSFNSIYVYAPELFPTNVRNVALGCLSMFARVGGIASSFAKSSIIAHPMISYFIFGALGIIAGLLTFMLPETLGSKPPDSFEELNQPKLRSSHEDRKSFVSLDSSRFRKASNDEARELLSDEMDSPFI